MTIFDQTVKEYIYPIVLKNKRIPILFSLSNNITIRKLTKKEKNDFFGIDRVDFIWGSDCKVNIGHVVIHNIFPSKKKGKSHYKNIMRVGMFDGTSDILASNYAIAICSNFDELDSSMHMINLAFKLLRPTSTGGYLGFQKNDTSVRMHHMYPVSIHGPYDYLKLSKSDITELQQIYSALNSLINDSELSGALLHYSRALENAPCNRGKQLDIRFLLLMIILDLMYIPDKNSKAKIMAYRVSSLLAIDWITYNKVCYLYQIRNAIIHDGKSDALTGRKFVELTEIVRHSLRRYLADASIYEEHNFKKNPVIECPKYKLCKSHVPGPIKQQICENTE